MIYLNLPFIVVKLNQDVKYLFSKKSLTYTETKVLAYSISFFIPYTKWNEDHKSYVNTTSCLFLYSFLWGFEDIKSKSDLKKKKTRERKITAKLQHIIPLALLSQNSLSKTDDWHLYLKVLKAGKFKVGTPGALVTGEACSAHLRAFVVLWQEGKRASEDSSYLNRFSSLCFYLLTSQSPHLNICALGVQFQHEH